ncbi:Sec-independent protein translocase subunit TatA [Actinacidiphila oryziradicis]|uniref:Sec-independent protein translocase protein TatA n=1 Tax=Actinacidiphila oryziradicis TaxID=2571141 RepID=A0A4U0RWE4_9ACTN|nr:Sec-independent protein translocase subunit TatA [Actinacidiphila oryziradicis]TKA00614.1 Sec-independent protein translocase subunit TatA [Actinacidiphila oryziradicis]
MLRNGLEPWHLIVVVAVVVLLFGSKRLPDAARSLGKSMRILKSETKAMKDDGAATTQATEATASGPAEQPATRIQATPGDTTARPVREPHSAAR